MRTLSVVRSGWAGAPGAVLLGALLAFHGCGLNDVSIPELDGPSTFAANLTLRINPDLLVADGVSQAVVTAVFFDQNGRPARQPRDLLHDRGRGRPVRGHRPLPDRGGSRLRGERAHRRAGRGPGRLPGPAAHRRHRRPDGPHRGAARSATTPARPSTGRSGSSCARRSPGSSRRTRTTSPTCDFVVEIPRGSCVHRRRHPRPGASPSPRLAGAGDPDLHGRLNRRSSCRRRPSIPTA